MGGVLFDAACGASETRAVWRGRALVAYGLVALLFILAGSRIVARNRDWANEETLWTVTARTAPRCVRAHYNLAGIHLQQKRIADAKREFATVLALAPDHVEALAGLGEIAFQQKQYGQALGFALQASAINPRNFRTLHLLGWTHLALQKLDDAETSFQQAMKLRPGYASTYTGLEEVAKKRGDAEAAARWAEKRRSLTRKKPTPAPA
jgi:tetratricopeptide (TPR) repeat protein